MLRNVTFLLCSLIFTLVVSARPLFSQVDSNPFPSSTAPNSIIVNFPAVVLDVDDKAVATDGTFASPSIYFKESGKRTYLISEARLKRNSEGSAQVELSNFKTQDGMSPVNLVTGTPDGTISEVSGESRAYIITWESIRLATQSVPEPVLTVAEVGSVAHNKVSIAVNTIPDKERLFIIGSDGLDIPGLLAKFKNDPGKIGVAFEFDKNDPVEGATNNIATARAVKLEGRTAAGVPNDVAPSYIIIDIGRDLPRRPAPYKIRFDFPTADLRGLQKPGYEVSTADEFLAARTKITLDPPSTDRAKAEFIFEGTFSSVVNAKDRKRSNVGLFGLHVKPTLPMLTYNVFQPNDSPWWMAFRPLLDADVDTRHIADSQAPNRIVFGADFELGWDTGLGHSRRVVQQMAWINGPRYDSDRDFKLQTLYWHTEFVPRFRNWEQTREQRLYQFRHPCFPVDGDCKVLTKKNARRFPAISSYSIQPSIGYQLGGTVNRDDRITAVPTTTISRLFVRYSSAVEIKRLFRFSLVDMYYFLENAPRRRNRNYLEASVDVNTGALFNTELGSLQSAITLKFQRGEQPPNFKPVNAFSFGLKLYR